MVALNCEAKPWVDFYGLKKSIDRPFGVYTKPGLDVEIVITGIGAPCMATAVGWVAGRSGSVKRVWLNLGIAGHLDKSVGEAIRVYSYIDGIDLRQHYSPLVAKWAGDSDALMSVNAPTSNYPDAAMVDMEGLSFYRSASMFSSPELVESIKVISDNQENNVEDLNASKITQLMESQLAMVNRFSDNLLALVQLSASAVIDMPLASLRRTHSQQQQLNRLLERAIALELEQAVTELELHKESKFDAVLTKFSAFIDAAAPSIGRLPKDDSISSTALRGKSHG